MARESRVYEFLPELRLRISGRRAVLRHFDAEYAPTVVEAGRGSGEVQATFGDVAPRSNATSVIGGHKTVRWNVLLSPPDVHPLRVSIALRGRPVGFGLSLVQGYFVEPLLSVAAAGARYVLLPSAAIVGEEGAVLLVGRSRSGKSSVTVRALAAGKAVLGDDQVFLDRSGRSWPFPRRLRFYSDIAETAPDAYRSLAAPTRATLVALGAVRRLTGGFVAPPVRVRPTDLGRATPRAPHALARVVVVERGGTAGELHVTELDVDAAVEQALAILDEQRTTLRGAQSPAWRAALARVRAQEEGVLRAAFRSVRIERVRVPNRWGAPEAIAALAEFVGAER